MKKKIISACFILNNLLQYKKNAPVGQRLLDEKKLFDD
jgi:hypothetical protein